MPHFPIKYIFAVIVIFTLLYCCLSGKIFYRVNDTKNFRMTDEAVINPFMGYAVSADNAEAAEGHSLVYIDVTFRQLQPQSPDKFDFEAIDAENNIALWKKQGKHAVLRFVCDCPSDEEHSDIPDWLMEITGDGSFYDTSYGKGYSPDYSNENFIRFHKNAIEALANHFDDGFVSYVQLGSIGHWGEWHVKSGEGIVLVPRESVREIYVSHYTHAFKNARLLMRRPFNCVKEQGLGLYNDMMGASEDTAQWLSWIENGGEYSQTGEEHAMSPVADFWKTAPSGGELTSSVSMEYICSEGLEETVKWLKKSHTTFIGPKTPVNSCEKAEERILSSIGYRPGITQVTVKQGRGSGDTEVTLKWENGGIAPVYFDLPVNLYVRGSSGSFKKLAQVNINLPEVLPGRAIFSKTVIHESNIKENDTLYIGIVDPMTGKPSVTLVSDQAKKEGCAEIYTFK